MGLYAGRVTGFPFITADFVAVRIFIRVIPFAKIVTERTDIQALIEEECSNTPLVNSNNFFVRKNIFSIIYAGNKAP